MATSVSSTSFDKIKQTQAAAQTTARYFSVHNSPKQSTEDVEKIDYWIIPGLLKPQVKKE